MFIHHPRTIKVATILCHPLHDPVFPAARGFQCIYHYRGHKHFLVCSSPRQKIKLNVSLSANREQFPPLNWCDWPLKLTFATGTFETLFKASHIQPWAVVRLALYASVRIMTLCERVIARMIMWGLNCFISSKMFRTVALLASDWKI